jgi:tetratricopeptide (TPR) repeat protein
MTLHNLAVLLRALGRHDEAEALYRRALALFRQALGPDHPKLITCLRSLARLLRDLGRTAEARALEDEARAARARRPPRRP